MRVDLLVEKLREQVLDSEIKIDDPILALSSWYIDVKANNFKVTIEYAPELDLFGLASQDRGVEGTDEVYRNEQEIIQRAKVLLATRKSSVPGTVSPAAYEWARQEADRLKGKRPELYAEFSAVADTFESATTKPLVKLV